MKTSFSCSLATQLGKVGTRTRAAIRLSTRDWTYALLDAMNFVTRTGNRRFKFERLYMARRDPWNYHSSTYERQKYERTLALALKWRRSSERALEVGCSIGIFSQMLAGYFDTVTAIDVSAEALVTAADSNQREKIVHFVRGDIRSLNIDKHYNVIVCAEVLYYVRKIDVVKVCQQLDQHLADNGVILMVDGFQPDYWEGVLVAYFEQVFKEVVEDASRPYLLAVFVRRVQSQALKSNCK
jgi:2-polyprenyl-3-methyl-5-hydroxy-6-metoxy-1,4-benzoquinol methylase